MIGFDLMFEESSLTGKTVNGFMLGCRRRGVHLTLGFGSPSFRIIPPLTISRAQIDRAIDVMGQALTELASRKTGTRKDWPKNPCTSQLHKRSPWEAGNLGIVALHSGGVGAKCQGTGGTEIGIVVNLTEEEI